MFDFFAVLYGDLSMKIDEIRHEKVHLNEMRFFTAQNLSLPLLTSRLRALV